MSDSNAAGTGCVRTRVRRCRTRYRPNHPTRSRDETGTTDPFLDSRWWIAWIRNPAPWQAIGRALRASRHAALRPPRRVRRPPVRRLAVAGGAPVGAGRARGRRRAHRAHPAGARDRRRPHRRRRSCDRPGRPPRPLARLGAGAARRGAERPPPPRPGRRRRGGRGRRRLPRPLRRRGARLSLPPRLPPRAARPRPRPRLAGRPPARLRRACARARRRWSVATTSPPSARRSARRRARSAPSTRVDIDESREPRRGANTASASVRARSCTTRSASIVGTLERVGRGAWPPERVGAALAARDRAACGPVCPPDGLYLVAVRYPPDPFAVGRRLGGTRLGRAGSGLGQAPSSPAGRLAGLPARPRRSCPSASRIRPCPCRWPSTKAPS